MDIEKENKSKKRPGKAQIKKMVIGPPTKHHLDNEEK